MRISSRSLLAGVKQAHVDLARACVMVAQLSVSSSSSWPKPSSSKKNTAQVTQGIRNGFYALSYSFTKFTGGDEEGKGFENLAVRA